MDEKIFVSSNTQLKPNKNMTSFSDCPNKCVDGFIVNPYKHKKELCPYCNEKRKQMLKSNSMMPDDKSIAKMLNLPESFLGINYDFDTIIPKFALKLIKDDSLSVMREVLKDFIDNSILGTLPTHSAMFNFGKKVNEYNFLYPLMIRYYLAGRTVTPLMSALDLCRLRMMYEKFLPVSPTDISYADLLDRDICVVDIDAGATTNSLDAVKGLMQLRARNFKSTIIVTNSWGRGVMDLCGDDIEKCYNLATLYSVEYEEKYAEKETTQKEQPPQRKTGLNSQVLSTNDFKKLISSQTNL